MTNRASPIAVPDVAIIAAMVKEECANICDSELLRLKNSSELSECRGAIVTIRDAIRASIPTDVAGRLRQMREYAARFHQIIMAVGNKYPEEERWQTALRYVMNAETKTDNTCKQTIDAARKK